MEAPGFAPLALVVAFGRGLAVVLVGVGLLAIAGNNAVIRGAESRRLLSLATSLAPVLAAASITLFGGAITTWSVMGLIGS